MLERSVSREAGCFRISRSSVHAERSERIHAESRRCLARVSEADTTRLVFRFMTAMNPSVVGKNEGFRKDNLPGLGYGVAAEVKWP